MISNMSRLRLGSGDVVVNNRLDSRNIGVLIEKCDLHEDYWKVLCEGDIVVWFNPNLQRIQDKASESQRA